MICCSRSALVSWQALNLVVIAITSAAAPTAPSEALGPSSRRTGLAISEVMYHPREIPGSSLEYIEIFNGQEYFEDLSGFHLDGDVHYTFPPGTILQSNAFLVVARDPAAIQNHYGISGVLGPWRRQTNVMGGATNVSTENLPNSRGTVRLENELGAHLLQVEYDSENDWPVAADGAGHSLVLARPSHGERSVKAWAASARIGGSPGQAEPPVTDPQSAIVINEFLANTDDPQVDYVELFNASIQAVDLSGCWLSDDFDTNKFRIPDGTIVPARGFVAYTQTELGFNLSSDGEEIFLVNSNRTRVFDGVRFGPQANGVARGRYPDGSPAWSELSSPSFLSSNPLPLRGDIIINEIMYHPISGSDDDEYVELYNRGTAPVDLGSWRFIDGVDFAIPPNTIINPGGYLVVAKNRTNLLARYPAVPAHSVVGDYDGQLSNAGERLALAMPDYSFQTNGPSITTNASYILVSEVTWHDGGRWGQWSDGGGSSLELIDPRSDIRLAANWGDSDETAKAPWTLIERTGPIALGMTLGSGTPNRCELFIEGPGECLIDDVEVRSNGGTNRVLNPGFESGPSGWAFQGTHARTSVQTSGAFAGNQCLHLRAVERGDSGPNRVRTPVAAMPTGGTNQATLRARVRWLRGDPNFLMRIRGQWIECAAKMVLPGNLGTPGAANSRWLPNNASAIYDVIHTPALPAAGQPVLVTARVSDPDPLSSVTLRHRLDPATNLMDIPMRDDGTAGDALAGDEIYSARIPGYAAATMVAFHISARDSHPLPATSLFPSLAPARECLVRFGQTTRPGTIATYHLWVTQSNINYWTTRERNSNEGLDATFVYADGRRIIYNAETHYSGSPWHTANGPYNGPLGNTCDYEVNFPKDDLFLGSAAFVLNGQNPVYSPTFHQDVSAQAETTAYWFGRKLGLGYNHKRHIFVTLNGQPRGMIYFDHQQPNNDIIEEYFPNDPNGRLHKIEDWFEFDDAGNGFEIITCTMQNFVVAGQKRPERYRWTWRPRAGTEPNDFADLFALVDAANAPGPEPYTSATVGLMDMRTCMRVWALQHMIGNWDSYGYERGKNMYAYKPTQGPWKLLLWDLDLVLGKDSRGTTDPLFSTANSEPVVARMYAHPPFVREFWCAMRELVDGPMLPEVSSPLVDARFAAFRANNVPVDTPTAMKNWIAARRAFILGQIPTTNFNVLTPALIQTTNNYITLTGTAPVTAKDILVNGGVYPITWTSPLAWTIRVPVAAGTNVLTVTAVDRNGNTISNRTVAVSYNGPLPDPAGTVVISEIMFNPPAEQASFLELHNTHPAFAFDLSDWRVNGLGYTFPPGATLAPRSYLVIAKNRGEFAKLYGATRLVFDQFDGALNNEGETLSLLRPGLQIAGEILVDKIRYEARAPWPAAANGAGGSLQLLDPFQDNSRVSNWGDGSGWRFFSVSGIPSETRFLLYLNSAGNVHIDDISLVTGTVPATGNNLLANGGFELPLAPDWEVQGTNGINSTQSPATNLTGNSSLDLRFTAAGGQFNYLYQDIAGLNTNATHTLSFWYLPSSNATNLEVRLGASLRATINVRAPAGTLAVFASPGTNSSQRVSLPPYPPLWLNEVQTANTTGFTDAQGEREPWLELYNSGATPIPLDGFYLTDNYQNLTNWAFPPGGTINPGQFKIIVLDGEPDETTAAQEHTSFRLTSASGSVALTRFANGVPQVVDYLNFDNLPPDRSYGSFPDGQLFDRQQFFVLTPGAANNGSAPPTRIYINEWMAANDGFIRDPADDAADDWFELYNPNSFAVDLGGLFLTDNLTNKFQFEIPDNGHFRIPPLGYLLVWADGETGQNSTNRADLHVNFQLRQAGEAIGLFAADGALIDAVTFGAQTNDISQGRYPEGTGAVYFMPLPSPGAANPNPNPSAPEILSITLAGGQISLITTSIPGRSYRVDYKDNLASAPWQQLGPIRVAASPTLLVQDQLTSQRFYRVFLLPP
ncbi:MAG: lamin tail domain-containing protein [Verrucomicrobia subdivision 3 bacterium]|nr:lamin tail domain-containing protein [Limisphaerales bacterium]